MGSNQEIGRIQEWVASLYGTSVENIPFSREDIRNICRGPMREVLVDFLVARFRTSAQIKVIRSNLFLTDISHGRFAVDAEVNGPVHAGSQDEEEIKELKGKLEEIHNKKVDIVKQISKAVVKSRESKVQLQKELLENVNHFEKLESRLQLIKHRVFSTTQLLDDVSYIKVPNPTIGDVETSVYSNGKPETVAASSLNSQLKGLYSKASDLFNLYFSQKPPFNICHSNSSTEIHALASAVSDLTDELTQSRLKPNFVEKWARKEQEISSHQISKKEQLFSNVMNPVEELAIEAEALHTKLMKAHVNLYFENREMRQSLKEIERQKLRKIQHLILNETTFIPSDLLSLVQKEEHQKKLLKCRELSKEFKRYENCAGDGRETDMLAMICGNSCSSNVQMCIPTSGNLKNERSAGTADGSFSDMKQQTLEELTCALMKGFSVGRYKLETTVSECKTLVLEKFGNLCDKEASDNKSNKLAGVQADRSDKIHEPLNWIVKLPPLQLKQDLMPTNILVPTAISAQNQLDSLQEVFMLQNELIESRLLCQKIFK